MTMLSPNAAAVDEHERDDRADHLVLGHLLPQEVVDDPSRRTATPTPTPCATPFDCFSGSISSAAHVDDDAEQEEAGDPGVGRAPAKPVERARHELGDDLLLRVGVVGLGDLRVDEVEEPQMADPHDARHDVDPSEDEVQDFADFGVHARVPLSRTWRVRST